MFTTVTTTLAVTISSVHFHANVMMVTKVIVSHVLILTNLSPVFTIVTQMQNEPMQKEVSTVKCNLEYAGSGVTCSDINECEPNDHNFDEIASCSNTSG